ncbi:hypothetical protein ES703_73614 [subsurface metagenome]
MKMSEKTIIKVGGMTCTMCAQTIEKALSELGGVYEANVNFATENATVEYNAEQTTLSQNRKPSFLPLPWYSCR